MFAAPTMLTRLFNNPMCGDCDSSGLRTIIYGGAPMYAADLHAGIEKLGQHFYHLYGQGESPMTITGLSKHFHSDTENPKYAKRLASVGLPRTGVAVKLLNSQGNPVVTDEIGEVVTKSQCVMPSYWNNPDATRASIVDGWLKTGDMGSLDEDGFLTLKDRTKDLIISGGSNIYPREIEEVLLQHSAVFECAVIGTPHPDWGEEVVAYVVANDNSTNNLHLELDQLCLNNIARFKRPKRYEFLRELPKNNYGKILKTQLRKNL
ncbi:UNVERIFIED_CONTAM: hypothetical protein GTU68_046709 [Idotea baltica]|nr:hypothetical protein [Idotea baltica]